jgi:hypothetical protein
LIRDARILSYLRLKTSGDGLKNPLQEKRQMSFQTCMKATVVGRIFATARMLE